MTFLSKVKGEDDPSDASTFLDDPGQREMFEANFTAGLLQDEEGNAHTFPGSRGALVCFVKEDCPTCNEVMPVLDALSRAVDGTLDMLRQIPEIDRVRDMGSLQEIQISGDPDRVLRTLIEKGRVNLFEVTQPTLHDIFIRIAGSSIDPVELQREGVKS